MPEVASAYVSLIPSFRGGASAITRETDKAARTSGKRFGGIFSGSLKAVIGGALAGAGVATLIRDSLGEAREAQKVGALTAQVIKTTGGAANVTAKKVGNLATAISNKVGIDDEAIQSGENLLLTFKNVRNEAGKGNKVFDRATKAAVDLSTAGFGDLSGTSKQLGKALNDPIKGITALSRSGVTFTEQQKAQIKTLVESNKTLDAQKIILREVESQVGGSAEAQVTASDKAAVAIGNLKEQIGTALLPVVDDLAEKVTEDVVPAVSEFVTGMQDGTGAGGEFVDVLKDTVAIGKGVVDFFDDLPGPIKEYGGEVLLASVALSKMNTGLLGAQRGMSGLSGVARNVSGAGGLVLLADSADEVGTKVSALKAAAGGALAGSALGAFAGPPGAVVGGALGALGGLAFNLATEIASTGDSASYAFPKFAQYADTLDDVSAATTRATREMALERLEKSGLLEQTEALGISDRDAVRAATGNEAARKRVSAALAEATRQGKNYEALQVANRLNIERRAVDESKVAFLQKNLVLADTREEAQRIQNKLDKLGATKSTPSVTIVGAKHALKQLTGVQILLHDISGIKGGNAIGPTSLADLLGGTPQGATGGIVTRPTLALIGEAGPEAVVPLNRTPGSSPLPTGQFVVENVYAQDVNDFLRQMQTRARHAAIGGTP